MRAQTFCYLPLFLVLNGVLFRHGERRCGTEGRTKLIETRIENPRCAFIERLSRHIGGNGGQPRSKVTIAWNLPRRQSRPWRKAVKQVRRCYLSINNYVLRASGKPASSGPTRLLAPSTLNGSYLATITVPMPFRRLRRALSFSLLLAVSVGRSASFS